MASKSQLPSFTNSEAFVAYIEDGFSNERNRNSFLNQFNLEVVSNNDPETVSTKHGICVSHKMTAKDLSPMRDTGTTVPMFIDIVSLTCLNPQTKSEAVELVYSHEYDARQHNPPLSDVAQSFFASLEFDSGIKAKSDEVCP